MEDLNYLYHRHQVSLMRADSAADDGSRSAHLEMAEAYKDRIERLRHVRENRASFTRL